MDILSNAALGLGVALSLTNLTYCFFGVLLGTLIGVIPGIGALTAISMLLPVTFYLDPTTALIMLSGIWYGTSYGGSTTSILLNIPGTPSNAITCLDGYPMAQQGRAGVALFMTTIASFAAASIGIIICMVFAPVIAAYALRFGPPEYFAIILFGLVAASTISNGSPIKALAMVVVGLMAGSVGMDVYTGSLRFTGGATELPLQLALVALAVGIFGVSEIILSVGQRVGTVISSKDITFRSMMPTRRDMVDSVGPVLRGTGFGTFFGALPGTGPSIAAFIAYATEKRVARNRRNMGNGAIEGIMAPEAANNAADQASFIPTLSLGIPGSPTMALMLGALMVHGITPGPNLIAEQPSLFWGLMMSFWIGNLMLLVLNIPLIGIWVRMLTIPYNLLYPAVLVFICIGVYSIGNSTFEVMMTAGFGLFGYLARYMGYPVAPLLLGFVLGPLLEEHFRRALLVSRGDFSVFAGSGISLTFLALTVALLIWGGWTSYQDRRAQTVGAAAADSE